MQTVVSIPGIHCASCAALLKDVSAEFPSIQNVDVDIEGKKVTLEHADDFDMQKWTMDIESLGDTYKVHPLA
ncbi:cation transporter [Candidatus Peregrinibacteria bacterium]|nr:cation transporter [Candidatus Peregrinibacteria bacterium]